MNEKENIFAKPTMFVGPIAIDGEVVSAEESHPIVFGKCVNPKIDGDSDGSAFKNTWSGSITATFTAPSKTRPTKGNRRQRKAVAFANKKTIFGFMEEYTARSPRLDRERKKRAMKHQPMKVYQIELIPKDYGQS